MFNLTQFQQELRDLLVKHNVTIGVDIRGDTHGIHEDFVVIDKDDNEHILNQYSAYVDASDLK